jgi:hypothetical protein
MYQKQKRLAMNREFHAEIDVIEIKRFSWFCDGEGREKKVVKIAVKIPQVIENTYRKNVRFSPLHDVHENKRVKPFSPRCC